MPAFFLIDALLNVSCRSLSGNRRPVRLLQLVEGDAEHRVVGRVPSEDALADDLLGTPHPSAQLVLRARPGVPSRAMGENVSLSSWMRLTRQQLCMTHQVADWILDRAQPVPDVPAGQEPTQQELRVRVGAHEATHVGRQGLLAEQGGERVGEAGAGEVDELGRLPPDHETVTESFSGFVVMSRSTRTSSEGKANCTENGISTRSVGSVVRETSRRVRQHGCQLVDLLVQVLEVVDDEAHPALTAGECLLQQGEHRRGPARLVDAGALDDAMGVRAARADVDLPLDPTRHGAEHGVLILWAVGLEDRPEVLVDGGDGRCVLRSRHLQEAEGAGVQQEGLPDEHQVVRHEDPVPATPADRELFDQREDRA